MATYEKMVLISEVEYMNLKNYKYLPYEIDGDEESDDDDDDESGYRPDRNRRQSQTPDDRHITTPSDTRSSASSARPSSTSSDTQSSASSARPSSTSARRSIDLTSSDTQSSVSSARSSMSSGDARSSMSASSARSSMSSGDARARAEAAQRMEEQRIEELRRAEEQRMEELRRAEEQRMEELRRAEETAQIAARMRAQVLADEEARRREDGEERRREEVQRAAQQHRDKILQQAGQPVLMYWHKGRVGWRERLDTSSDCADDAPPDPPPLQPLSIRKKDRPDVQQLQRLRHKSVKFEIKARQIIHRKSGPEKQRYRKIIERMRRNTAKQEQYDDMVARWRQRRELREAMEWEDRLKHLDRDLRIVLKRINQDDMFSAYGDGGEGIPDVGAEVEMESFMSDEQRAAADEQRAAEEHAAEEQRLAEEAQREYEEWQLGNDEDRRQRAAEYNAFLDKMAARDAEQADMETEEAIETEESQAGEVQYDLRSIPAKLREHAQQLLDQLEQREILFDSNVYAHADDPYPDQMNIDVPRFLQLAVRNIHKKTIIWLRDPARWRLWSD